MSDKNREYLDHYESPLSISEQLRKVGFDISHGGREIREGYTQVGIIVHIKQIHNNSDNPSKLAFTHPARYETLIRYQQAIYGELSRNQIEHIFVEGVHTGQIGKILQEWKSQMREKIQDPHVRRNTFAQYGGAFVYFLDHPNVQIHATESKYILDRIRHHLETSSVHLPKKLNQEREGFAMKEIRTFLEASPGSKVALVYGSSHDFQESMKIFNDKPPRQEIISFDAIAKDYLEGK